MEAKKGTAGEYGPEFAARTTGKQQGSSISGRLSALGARAADHYAVLCCTMDYFNEMSELIGEEVMQSVHAALVAQVEQEMQGGEFLCQSTDDGFFALLQMPDREAVDRRVERWGHILRRVARVSRIPFVLSLTVGVYPASGAETSASDSQLFRRATFAQRSGRIHTNPCVRYYSDAVYQSYIRHRYLELQMHTALQSGQFVVNLQPQYRLCDGQIIGAEALVRWNNPEMGLLMPDEFIPLFESDHFILQLDLYMLEEVCKLQNRWWLNGMRTVPISVNFSRLHATTGCFLPRLTAVLEKYDIPPDLLQVEWTESAFLEEDVSIGEIAEQMRSVGLCVAMDDFGSGYSSLNSLSRLPIDIVKLDKGFFHFEEMDDRCRLMLESIISALKDLKYKIIAEGVEHEWQRDFLRGLGCDAAQGYYFSRPLNVSAFETLVNA